MDEQVTPLPNNQSLITVDEAVDMRDPQDKYVPEGFESADEFLAYARDCYDEDIEFDNDNREAAYDDLEFLAKDQWDPEIRSEREAMGLPCMEVNFLQQVIGQVIGDMRMNKTQIRCIPKQNATVEDAEIRASVIKGVEANNRATRKYDSASEDQLGCGMGYLRVNLDYADDNVFFQDIYIRHVPNCLSVVMDWMSQDSTGADARRTFVEDTLPHRDFQAAFPNSIVSSHFGDHLSREYGGWYENNAVRVCEFWEMKDRPGIYYMRDDGGIFFVQTEEELVQAAVENNFAVNPKDGKPYVRRGTQKYACMHLITATEILAGPYELPIRRIPIVRVEGRVVRVGDEKIRFGMVRFAKDSQRMKNFWRSVAVEKLAMAPKTVWTAQAAAVKGREEDWRNAHRSRDPLLIFNDNTEAPQRVDPPAMDAAILQEVQMNMQDIKDVTGIHDASLGIRSNEVSGKAIMARQHEGDVATFVYKDKRDQAIQEIGVLVNQLIPVAYDTVRTLRTVGIDDKEKLIKVNDNSDPDSPDLAMGEFDIDTVTGPSYATQRMMAADAMMEAVKVTPDLFGIAGDLIVEAQDWPGAQKIAARYKKIIPQHLLDEDDLSEEQKQQAQQQAQRAAAEAEMQQKAAALEFAEKEAEVRKKNADAEKAEADARRAAHDADKAESEAEEAEHRAEMAEIELNIRATTGAAEVLRAGERPEQSTQPVPDNSSGASRRGARSDQPRKRKRK